MRKWMQSIDHPEKFHPCIVCVTAFGLFGLFSAFHQDTKLDDSWLGTVGRRGENGPWREGLPVFLMESGKECLMILFRRIPSLSSCYPAHCGHNSQFNIHFGDQHT